MRAPKHFFGSISPRVFAPVFVAFNLLAFASAHAQLPMPGLGGGFEVDGNLFANNPGGIVGLGNDWLDGPAGPGSGVLNADGTPKDPVSTIHTLDRIEGNDLDVFDGSNKVFANPNTYKWKGGSVPQKDDIQNGLVHFSEDNLGNHWMRMAGDRRSINGSSYIDYEFLQATLTKNPNGTFTSGGPHGGRTVGDILLTIHLTQGGSQAAFYAQQWQAVGAGYDYVTIPFPSGQAFVAANVDSIINSSYDVFGNNAYGINQFGEAAVNLDALLPNFGTCFGIATVFVRTKSSTSNDAVLKDFIEPVQVNMCLDETPPVLTAPADVTLKCGDSTNPGVIGIGGATDDCDTDVEVTYTDTIIPGGCAYNFTIHRLWKAIDGCGNTDEATQIITMVDETPPVITSSPGPVTIQCTGDIPNPNPNAVSTTDCGAVTVTHVGDVSNGETCPQVITRTYRATDACGNFRDVTQTITIDDTTAPTVGTLSPITLQCRDNVPAPNIALVSASDNCGTPVVRHLSDVSNGQTCPEVITRTYRVTDACGNLTDRVQTITIDDTSAPIVGLLYPVTVECRGDVPAPNITVVTASDNCSTPVVTHLSDVSNGQSCAEVITRTYRVTDACGNVTDRAQLITVDDTTNPNISGGPADVTVSCSGQIPAPNIGAITATDNCSTPNVTHVGDVSDGRSCPQIITRTYRATDACGNAKDFVQKITLDDNTAPTVSPLADINVSCAAEVPAPNTGLVQANDNCGQVFASHVGDQPYGNGCGGKIVRTYRVADTCGNETTVTQRIIINDRIAPVITGGPQNVSIECDGDIPPVDISSIQATDNCGTVRIVWVADFSDGGTCPKKITRRYSITDPCNNVATYNQIITIDDTIPPTLSNCGTDRTLECWNGPGFTTPTATDNCDPSPEVSVIDSRTTFGPEGWTYRIRKTWAAFDDCHNKSTECTQTLTIHCESDHLSSLTQGAYGSYGGKFNDIETLPLVQGLLLNNPMVVGKPGRSVTFEYSDADCIIQRMPGNTTPSTLPNLGDKAFSETTCQVPGNVPIPLNSGKFESVLLGQTITLIFNSRLSAAMPLFPLTHKFCTQGALPGKDGKLGTADDKIDPNSPVKTFYIPTQVLAALDNLGLPRIVYGLIELCNRGLAAQPTGGATLSQINDAATAINEGFDGCRFIVSCGDPGAVVGTALKPGNVTALSITNAPSRFELKQNAPNPFNPATTIRIAIPEAADWNLSVYDIGGRLVKRFDGQTGGATFVDVRWDGTDQNGSPVSSGVYLYRVRAGHYVDTRKMVLLK